MKTTTQTTEPELSIEIKEVMDNRHSMREKSEVDLIIEADDKPRRRRGRNKKDKIYFSKATQDAIIEYNNEECEEKRNILYEEKIKYGFEKLVENIYNTYKFSYFDAGPIEVQQDTVSHLVSSMHKYDSEKGKAFSYFSIVAKNYLILHNNGNHKKYNQHVCISDTPSENEVCLQKDDPYHANIQRKELLNKLIAYWETNVNTVFTKEKDLKIANSVIELMRKCDRIEAYNKKTLYLYIREMSSCKTQQITKVINKMKLHQDNLIRNYVNTGEF